MGTQPPARELVSRRMCRSGTSQWYVAVVLRETRLAMARRRPSSGERAVAGRFRPVAAIRCTDSIRRRAGRGQWEVQVRQVASHGFGRLLAALRRPDARQPADVFCAAVAVPPPMFVLAGRDGQVIRVGRG